MDEETFDCAGCKQVTPAEDGATICACGAMICPSCVVAGVVDEPVRHRCRGRKGES